MITMIPEVRAITPSPQAKRVRMVVVAHKPEEQSKGPSGWCIVAVMATLALCGIGCLPLLSRNPKAQKVSHYAFEAAGVTGDFAQHLCAC